MLDFFSQRRQKEKMPLTSKRLAGPGFIILNVMRAMNIIGLVTVIAANIIMVIRTFVVSKFFFFDAATHIVAALASMFFVVSECSIFKSYFAKNWPVLSYEHGFNFLGVSMVVLGNNLLGNLNKEATSQKSLGMAFWRIVIGSGIIIFVLGFLNIAASLIFRDTCLKVTARQIRSKGAVAITDAESACDLQSTSGGKPGSIVTSFPSASNLYSPSAYSQASPIRKSPVRAWAARARDSILPSYRSQVPPYPKSPPQAAVQYPQSPVRDVGSPIRSPAAERAAKAVKKDEEAQPSSPVRGIEISAPLNVNPQFAHLVRPDIAHHPSQRGR